MTTGWQPELDGVTPPPVEGGPLTTAASATIAALEHDGLLESRHALSVQLVLTLSRALDTELAGRKITVAASQATRQLLDALAALPTPVDAPSPEWDDMLAAFATADREARA